MKSTGKNNAELNVPFAVDEVYPANNATTISDYINQQLKTHPELQEISQKLVPLTEKRLDLETRQKLILTQIEWLEGIDETDLQDKTKRNTSYCESFEQAIDKLTEERVTYLGERGQKVEAYAVKATLREQYQDFALCPVDEKVNKEAFIKTKESEYQVLDGEVQKVMDELEPLVTTHSDIKEELTQKAKQLTTSIHNFFAAKSNPFAKACLTGDIDCVKKEIADKKFDFSKKRLVNTQDAKGFTHLQLACRGGHIEIVKILLAAGANPNKPSSKGFYAIHETVLEQEGKNTVAILYLLKQSGADLTLKNVYGRTVLHTAAFCNDSNACLWLIQQGVIDINAKESEKQAGRTALHIAASKGHVDVVSLLLKNGANHLIPNQAGESALLDGIIQGKFNLIDIFMDHGIILSKVERIQLAHCASKYKQSGLIASYNEAFANASNKSQETLNIFYEGTQAMHSLSLRASS